MIAARSRWPLRILFLTVFIDLMGFGVVVPILAFVSKEYGASGMTLGLILGSFSLMQFLFSPLWGRLSDRIGRRPVLMISLFGNVLGFSCFALASNVTMLFATRIISGIASASIPAAQAYIADTADESSRAKEMGRISMAFGLGLVFGPPFGGLLSSIATDMGLRPNVLPGVAAAAMSATALLMAIFALPESLSATSGRHAKGWSILDNESWRILFRTRALRLSGTALAVLMCTLASLAPLLVLVGRDRYALAAREVGYLMGLMGVVVVALQLGLLHRLTRRFGDIATALIGAAALVIGLLLVPLNVSRAALIAAVCLMGLAQGLCHPTLSAFVSKVAPPAHRGGILGVSSSMTALARVMGPALAGLAYDALRTAGAIASQVLVVIGGIALLLRLLHSADGVSESQGR
ncbi:MAG TPA: MFS transporter [Thermoanaerobaculia bacterium]|jgi:MFS family permease|nr:MFS transporter [Thermoanaerobaculia bacterium]